MKEEKKMEEIREVNVEELEEVSGGKASYGGSPKKLPDVSGRKVYRIQSGDSLGKIARANKTTVETIKKLNPTITDPNRIMAGYYIYVPA